MDTAGDGHDLVDQIFRDIEFDQRGLQVASNGIEVIFIEALCHQGSVGCAHVFAGIAIGATEDHGQKRFLLGVLFVHISGLKEVTDTVIRQDLAIKDINGGIDGGFTTNLIK